jgi:hypothetical protein
MGMFDGLFGSNKTHELRRGFDPKDWPYRSSEEHKEIEHFSKLALQGSRDAIFTLASYRIMSLEWEKSAELLKQAADLGDKDAMGLLAVMCGKGIGVPQDEKQGLFWFEKSGGVLSLLSQYPPRQFAKEVIAGKKLIEIQVRRRIYDPKNSLTWMFLGAPTGEYFFVQVDPTDIENVDVWSTPNFIRDEASPYKGFHEQNSMCMGYFNLESYKKSKESFGRQPFATRGKNE